MNFRWVRNIDAFIFIPAVYLTCLGCIVLYSISNKTQGVEVDLNITTQVIASLFGLIFALIISGFGRSVYMKWALLIYMVSVGLLILVQLIGTEINGSQRWVAIGPIQIQPTEIAKVGLVLFLAKIFDTREATVNRLRTIVFSIFITAIPVALILIQPDLGSSVVLLAIWSSIIYSSHLKLSKLGFLMIAIIATALVLTPFLAEYQQERLVSYFNPDYDQSGSSYNVLQAGIAIGSGGLVGKGLESGTQSQLNFLPSQHTDFIFAVISEKLGFLGAFSVILALSILMCRFAYIAYKTTNQFERSVMTGLTGFIFFHAFVNIGMNIGIVPVTGLPLPFVSYGGTFVLVCLLAVGIAMSVSSSALSKNKQNQKHL